MYILIGTYKYLLLIATEVFDITKNCLNKFINFKILQNNLKHTFTINYELLGVGHITQDNRKSRN